jgi:hypothetical protein
MPKIFLELGRIHFTAENISGGKEVTLKFLECQLGHLI